MSYSRVTVNVPASTLQVSDFEGISDKMQLHLLPMNGLAACNHVTDPSLDQYKEMLKPYNMQMMQWLQNPDNALLFAADPLKAFQTAVDAPEELIARLKEAKLTPMENNGIKEDVMSHIRHNISESLANQIGDLTEGWDIVIGMRQDAVNKGLQYAYDKNLFPHSIAGECDSPLKLYDKIIYNAELSAPKMTDGTGSNITVSLSAKSGTLELTGAKPIKADITQMTINLTLNLIQIKSPVQPATGTRYDFMLDIASPEAFVGLHLDNVPPELEKDPSLVLLAEFGLIVLLRETYVGKEYKIFSADLNGAGEFSFLIPEEIDYAGQSSAEQQPAVGALIKTPNGHQGVIQLHPDLFPKGTEDINAVMAMSRDLFLKNTGLQGLVNAFKVNHDVFDYDTNSHRVYNKCEFNYYQKVKGYTVKIRHAYLSIENNELVIRLDARVEPTSGIYIDYTVYAPYQASIQDKDGKQIIHFDMDKKNYKESHEVSAEWWVWLVAILALFIGALILGIILAIMDSVAPDIGASTFTGAIDDVKWNYYKITKLKTIDMGDCIRIGCNAVFELD